jgi:hypothetical protein
MHQLVAGSSAEAKSSDLLSQLTQLTALMASMPCHVARDGMISQRHEARAAAAAMWSMKGNGTGDAVKHEPPVPYAVRQVDLQTLISLDTTCFMNGARLWTCLLCECFRLLLAGNVA